MDKSIYLLTPCLNAATTIDRTIWAIVSQQGHGSIRYHVQDGGSTDGTLEILARWEEKIRALRNELPMCIHFTYTSERDTGMYDAINRGFRYMNIPPDAIMGWCNSDDTIWQGTIEFLTKIDSQFPEIDWLTGWPTAFDAQGRLTWLEHHPFFPQQILAAGLADGPHWAHLQQESTFWRKRLWDENGGVDDQFKLAGDWDLWRRFAQSSELIHVDRQIGSFHFRPGQKSSDINSYQNECEKMVPTLERYAIFRRLLNANSDIGIKSLEVTNSGELRLKTNNFRLSWIDKIKVVLWPRKYLLRRLGRWRRLARK